MIFVPVIIQTPVNVTDPVSFLVGQLCGYTFSIVIFFLFAKYLDRRREKNRIIKEMKMKEYYDKLHEDKRRYNPPQLKDSQSWR